MFLIYTGKSNEIRLKFHAFATGAGIPARSIKKEDVPFWDTFPEKKN
jgi:hypothetical protein